MRQTLLTVVKTVGRLALGVAVFATSTLSIAIAIGMFLGMVSMMLSGFDLLPRMSENIEEVSSAPLKGYHLVVLCVAAISGLYLAAITVAYTFHLDKNAFEKNLLPFGNALFWMLESTFLGFLSFILIVSLYASQKDSSPKVAIYEARYFLLFALALSLFLAAESVYRPLRGKKK